MKHKIKVFRVLRGGDPEEIYSFESDLIPKEGSWLVKVGGYGQHSDSVMSDKMEQPEDEFFKVSLIVLASDNTYRVYVHIPASINW
mgnify:CR=1 FL=1